MNETLIEPKQVAFDDTVIRRKIFGKEVVISKPIELPNPLKEWYVNSMKSKFQKAFPTVDFSSIKGSDLHHFGIQAVLHDESHDSQYVPSESGYGTLLEEALNHMATMHVMSVDKHQHFSLKSFRSIDQGLGNPSIRTTCKNLTQSLIKYHTDEVYKTSFPTEVDPHQLIIQKCMQDIGKALFTGNIDVLKQHYETGKLNSPKLADFETFAKDSDIENSMPSSKKSDHPEGLKQYLTVAGLNLGTGNYENPTIYLSIFGEAALKSMSIVTKILSSIPKLRLKYDDALMRQDEVKLYRNTLESPLTHEFSHFFSHELWKKRGLSTVSPALHQ